MSTERLDKFIATQKNLPRREARQIISRGQVMVNGIVARAFDTRIDTAQDKVELSGEQVVFKKYVYIVINKPKGVLSATSDKRQSTVLDLIPEHLKRKELFPVGRLDKDTTGLLLITDDGEFAHRVISPKSNISKTYTVLLDGEIEKSVVDEFKKGVTLHDGTRCLPAELVVSSENPRQATVTIMEGKYHQIKRMFGVYGLGVVELHRNSVGNFLLDENLKSGECRELSSLELALIYKGYSNLR